jgi:putative transposase
VSRKFVAATETALAELLAADLSALDLVALTVDGVHVGESVRIVALGIDAEGTKHPLALVEGSTENATVVTDLLTGLRDRGLDVTRPILVGIDGAKALRKAVIDVFDCPVIQRCQLHKIRRTRRRSATDRAGPRAGQDPPRCGRQSAEGDGRDADRAAAGRVPDAGPHAALDQRDREHDLHLPGPLGQRQALARRADGAALVRRGHGRGRQAVPPGRRSPAPGHAALDAEITATVPPAVQDEQVLAA